jgi:hypothetical protein
MPDRSQKMAVFIVISARASCPISLLGILMFPFSSQGNCWDRVLKHAVTGSPLELL